MAKKYEYCVELEENRREKIQSTLNEQARDGWEFVTAIGSGGASHSYCNLIFRREK